MAGRKRKRNVIVDDSDSDVEAGDLISEESEQFYQDIMGELTRTLRSKLLQDGESMNAAKRVCNTFHAKWLENLDRRRKQPSSGPPQSDAPILAHQVVPDPQPLKKENKVLLDQWQFPLDSEDDDSDDLHDFQTQDRLLTAFQKADVCKGSTHIEATLHSGVFCVNNEEFFFSGIRQAGVKSGAIRAAWNV